MQRSHSNVHKGEQVTADLEGELLSDIEACRTEGIAAAREMLANSIRSGEDPPDHIEVTDSDGKAVLTIALASLLPSSMKTGL